MNGIRKIAPSKRLVIFLVERKVVRNGIREGQSSIVSFERESLALDKRSRYLRA